jgi:hypothetical protein
VNANPYLQAKQKLRSYSVRSTINCKEYQKYIQSSTLQCTAVPTTQSLSSMSARGHSLGLLLPKFGENGDAENLKVPYSVQDSSKCFTLFKGFSKLLNSLQSSM